MSKSKNVSNIPTQRPLLKKVPSLGKLYRDARARLQNKKTTGENE